MWQVTTSLKLKKREKKRYMSRIRKRPNLQIQNLNDGTTTFVPVVPSVDRSHAASVNYDNQNMSAPACPISGVKDKLEHVDNLNILYMLNL